jgi:hypothetical protein
MSCGRVISVITIFGMPGFAYDELKGMFIPKLKAVFRN